MSRLTDVEKWQSQLVDVWYQTPRAEFKGNPPMVALGKMIRTIQSEALAQGLRDGAELCRERAVKYKKMRMRENREAEANDCAIALEAKAKEGEGNG